MSKLPKAPLLEVIFEIRWTVTQNEVEEVKYLHGDLYPLLKNEYPHRESVNPNVPAELMMLHAPTHRFRVKANDYPLVQVGPCIVTVNTIDSKYNWEEYQGRIISVIEKLQSAYALKHHHNVQLVIQYIDFLKFDFQKGDIIKFLKENLNISISQEFYKGKNEANQLIFGLSFPTDIGILSVNFGRGLDMKSNQGISINTNIFSHTIKPEIGVIKNWLNQSHEVCSQLFKDMTKGKLYDSFK